MGTIYKRGKTWWIKYYNNGKPVYESSKSEKRMIARTLLNQRLGDISQGKPPGTHYDRVTFSDLAEDYLSDYRINQKKTLLKAEQCLKHLGTVFGNLRATNITTSKVNRYVEKRISEGATNGTVNRELAALKRMFNIGARQTPPRVAQVPYIPMLQENNTRKGFFEHSDFLALKEKLPEYLKGFATFGYKIGWRINEIRDLTWNHVDRTQGIVTLMVGDTKNKEARTIYLDEELRTIIMKQWEKRKDHGKLTPYVFTNAEGTGKVGDIRWAWKRACKDAGIGLRLFHDFRRTAVRNMVRAGIPERVAMMISGHKTRSVFDRYNIVSAEDLKQAAEKQQAYLEKIGGMVTNTVTIHDLEVERKSLNP
jgi:integrase